MRNETAQVDLPRPTLRRWGSKDVGSQGRSSAGFSVLEALLVVFVVGFTTVIGGPSVMTHLRKQRLESVAADVANLMRQTRLRAIRDNSKYLVEVNGTEIVGMGARGKVPIGLTPQAPVRVYQAGDGDADCLSKYDGTGATLDGAQLIFRGNGSAIGTGAICIHDGRGNILQVVVEYATSQPKIRKYLEPSTSPTTEAGFFEKTSYSKNSGTGNVWAWY